MFAQMLLFALLSIIAAFLLAASEAAIFRMSRVRAQELAAEAGHAPMEEMLLLTTHGILHLLGYDHAEPDEEREMFALQNRLLQSWRAGRRAG